MNIENLKQAGFSDIEINAWMQKKRDLFSQAGFSDKEIDDYFGIKKFDRKPLMDAISEIQQEQAEFLAREEQPQLWEDLPEKPKEGEKAAKRTKGPGYFGELKRPDAYVSTELSIGVNIDGQEIEIPSLVPTLTEDEKNYLLGGNEPTEEIVNKAVAHARIRISEGKSPFAELKEEKPERKEPGIYPEKEPSWIQKFIRLFEPPWEEKGARATLAVEAAGKTGLPPHVFEPTTGEVISKGFKASVTGLLATGKLPESLPESAQKYMMPSQRILMQASTLLGDLPFMTIGALIGGGGGPPTAVGGAFALPAGLRKVLMDKYEKGEIHSFSEFWKRLTDAVYETLKGEAVGVATGFVGVRVPGLGRVPAEVVTMVTVGDALEGEIPEPQEFIDGAIIIGGMRFSTRIAGKLRNIYWQSGKKPAEVIEDIKENPSIKEDLLSDNKTVPDKYKAPEPIKPNYALMTAENIGKELDRLSKEFRTAPSLEIAKELKAEIEEAGRWYEKKTRPPELKPEKEEEPSKPPIPEALSKLVEELRLKEIRPPEIIPTPEEIAELREKGVSESIIKKITEKLPVAEFIGWQETLKGEQVALYNVGKDTMTKEGLARRGIPIPETPPPPLEPRVSLAEAPAEVKDAVIRYRQEGGRGISWIWDSMTKAEREAFDKWIIETNHPLATQPGSAESRFNQVVKEYAEKIVEPAPEPKIYPIKEPQRVGQTTLDLVNIPEGGAVQFGDITWIKIEGKWKPQGSEQEGIASQLFADRIKTETTAKEAKVSPEDQKLISKFREAADKLTSQIKEKREPAISKQALTARRAGIAESMAADADRLEQIQNVMNGMAGAIENRTLPESLKGVTNKAQIETLRDFRGEVYPDINAVNDWIATQAKRLKSANINTLEQLKQAQADIQAFIKGPSEEVLREKALKAKEAEFIGKKIPGFFPTPEPVGKMMVDLAGIEAESTVLEPSAGMGNLAEVIRGAHPETALSVIEWNRSLREVLDLKKFKVIGDDFLKHEGKYDRIVQNPPFEKGQDIDHVYYAYEHLNPGGRLISVMSEGPFFKTDNKSRAFRKWFEEKKGSTYELEGAFKGAESFRQTGVKTRIVMIDKPMEKVAEPPPKPEPKITGKPGVILTDKQGLLKEIDVAIKEAPEDLSKLEIFRGRYTNKTGGKDYADIPDLLGRRYIKLGEKLEKYGVPEAEREKYINERAELLEDARKFTEKKIELIEHFMKPVERTFQVGPAKISWLNSKGALKEFRQRIQKTPEKQAITVKPTVRKPPSIPRPVAAKREQIEELIKLENAPGWFSDGHILIKGEPPKTKKFAEFPKSSDPKPVFENMDYDRTIPGKLQYYYSTNETLDYVVSKEPVARLSDTYSSGVVFKCGDKYTAYVQDKFNAVRNRFPDAEYRVNSENGMLVAYKDQKPVAGLMPFKPLRETEGPLYDEPPLKAEAEGYGFLSTDTATMAFAPEAGFRRKPEPPTEIEKPVKRSDMVTFLREKLDVPIRTGRFWGAGRRYLGIFKLKEEVIRTKFASDIETICHEVGHGLHKFLWPEARTRAGLSSKPFEPWRKELLAIATKPRAGQAKLPEGFAEFVRLYVTNEKQALEKAPEFYKAFEAMLDKKSPEAKAILLETRKEFEKWIKQPAEMRVLSQVSVGAREKRLPRWSDLYTATVDDLHPLKRVVEAMTRGEKIPAEKDPYKLARLMRGWHGRAEHFMEYSPYLFKTYENVGKPLRRILEPVKDNLDEFRVFIVSKRALELRNRGIETGVLSEDAEFVVNKYEPVYGKIFKDLIEYQDATLAYLVDSGLVSTKNAIKMKELNQDYVPFYRIMETDRSRGSGVGLQARQPIKRIRGSWRDIQDPLESIIKNTYLYINLAEKNAVGRALVRLAETNEGMGKYVERIPEPKQVIKIKEPELWGLLQKYGKWTETSKYKELQSEIREKVIAGEDIKPIDKVEERVREALTNRGFSEGETSQIVERLKGAKTSEAKNKIIERTIEKVAVIQTTKEFGLELPEGVAEIFRPSAFIPKDNVIAVWRAGKRNLYEVHPDVARTMLALDRESVNLLIRILGMPASWLRAGATLTPEFIARNPFRDQFSAFVYSKYNYAPGYDLAKGVFSLAKKDIAYQQWIKAGGLRSMLVSMDRKYLQKNLGQVLQKTPVRNIIKNPIEALRILSETMEAGTRLGEFKKGIGKEGVTKTGMLEAAYASREVTLDFARIGAKTRAVNTLIAFWNANVQGLDKMRRAFIEQPAMTTAKVFAGITLPSVILTIINRQDERWKEIPQWQKDLFWIVMTENHIYRIPKPFELGILFGTVPERITEYILDKDPHAFDGLLQAVGRGAAPGAIPTVALPWMENWANKSLFLDRPIIPAAREKVLPEYQYKPYTTEVAKLIGRALGELPPLKRSPYISPARIENLIRGWSGGLGIHILKVADEALRRTGVVPEKLKPTRTLADIPLIKGFIVRHPSGQAESIKKFYDNYQEIEQIIATIKVLSKKEFKYEEAIAILEEDAEQVAIRLTGIYKGLSNAQNTISFIYENPDISPDEKRQLIDLIYYNMIDMARGGNAIVEQVKKMAKENL